MPVCLFELSTSFQNSTFSLNSCRVVESWCLVSASRSVMWNGIDVAFLEMLGRSAFLVNLRDYWGKTGRAVDLSRGVKKQERVKHC